jgi:hypothetical protein
MDRITLFHRAWLCSIFGVFLSFTQVVLAESLYQPGESVEYKVRGSYPEKWDLGRIIREYPGGSQYLIREAPTPYFPEGPEAAHASRNYAAREYWRAITLNLPSRVQSPRSPRQRHSKRLSYPWAMACSARRS